MNIKYKIALSKLLNKNLDKEIDSEYIRFYRLNNTEEIYIFMLKLGWIVEGKFVYEVVQDVIEPITDTLMYRFHSKKFLHMSPLQDYSGNLEFASLNLDNVYEVVPNEEVLPNIELPEKITISDIYTLYKLIKQNTKENKLERKRRIKYDKI